jgi:hypothetical protein
MTKLEYLFSMQQGEINAPVNLNADFAMIYKGDATEERFKAGDIICFSEGMSEKDFHTDNLLFLAEINGDRSARLGRITWHEYYFTFSPIDGDRTPIKNFYFKAKTENAIKVVPIARAVGFVSEL